MGVEEILLEEPVGIKDFQVKEGDHLGEMVIREEEEEVMMILTLVMMGMDGDVWVELMGRASAQVKRIIRSLPMDIEWK